MIIGDRVGAICGKTDEGIEFFGYGVFQGEEVPPKGTELMGIDLSEYGTKNPKILLDNGGVVWGCQCWWGPEKRVKESLKGKNVINITLEQALDRSKKQV